MSLCFVLALPIWLHRMLFTIKLLRDNLYLQDENKCVLAIRPSLTFIPRLIVLPLETFIALYEACIVIYYKRFR